MKKNKYWRFILNNVQIDKNLKEGGNFELNNEEIEIFRQLTRVFRCKIGDFIVLMNKNYSEQKNTEFRFEIVNLNKKQIELVLKEKQNICDPLKEELGLVLALPNKPSKIEEILMHCTELGTTEFILVEADNSNFNHKLRIDRLDKIIQEATEQCERARLPKIRLYKNFDQYLDNKTRDCFVGIERGEQIQSFLTIPVDSSCDILIGPEGGFSEREMELFDKNSLKYFSLGKSILRTQTAAIVSTGIAGLKFQKQTIS